MYTPNSFARLRGGATFSSSLYESDKLQMLTRLLILITETLKRKQKIKTEGIITT